MICIVESTTELIQNKNTKIQTYTCITYNLYNHYIQFSDHCWKEDLFKKKNQQN